MKKILFAVVALMVGLTAFAAPNRVRVNLTSGENLVISFSAQPEILFLADGIKVTSNATDAVTYEFDDVESIDFVETSAVDNVVHDVIGIFNYPASIEFTNVPEGSTVKLFSLDGRLLYTAPATGSATIDKSGFPHGIYIVVVGNSSFKVSF